MAKPQSVTNMNLNDFQSSHRKPELKKTGNVLKICLMVSCVVSFLLVFHADVYSEHYEPFFVQAGVSASFVPSLFRVTTPFMNMGISPFIDMTVLMFMTAHLTAAGIVLYLVIVELTSGLAMLQIPLAGAAVFITISVSICVAEFLRLILDCSKLLRRRSSSWAAEDLPEDSADQVTAVI